MRISANNHRAEVKQRADSTQVQIGDDGIVYEQVEQKLPSHETMDKTRRATANTTRAALTTAFPSGYKILAQRGDNNCGKRSLIYGLLLEAAYAIKHGPDEPKANAIKVLETLKNRAQTLLRNIRENPARYARFTGNKEGLFFCQYYESHIIPLIDGIIAGTISLKDIAFQSTADFAKNVVKEPNALNLALADLAAEVIYQGRQTVQVQGASVTEDADKVLANGDTNSGIEDRAAFADQLEIDVITFDFSLDNHSKDRVYSTNNILQKSCPLKVRTYASGHSAIIIPKEICERIDEGESLPDFISNASCQPAGATPTPDDDTPPDLQALYEHALQERWGLLGPLVIWLAISSLIKMPGESFRDALQRRSNHYNPFRLFTCCFREKVSTTVLINHPSPIPPPTAAGSRG